MRQICLLVSWTFLALSATVSHSAVSVTLDDELKFVVHGEGDELVGVSFDSKSGSIIPGPEGNAGPFEFTLVNRPTQVAYGSLQDRVFLDGSITMPAGWNPLGEADVTYEYGPAANIGPFPLFTEPPGELDVVRMTMTDDFRFVLHGDGDRLNRFDLNSPAGSLIPGDSPAPFSEFAANTPNQISLTSVGNHTTLDGSIELTAGWNRDLGVRDVSYQYRADGSDVNVGPYRVPDSVYPPPPPSSRIQVTINEDARFVLHGTGHQLRSFDFDSPSGSLDPGGSAAPFGTFDENSPTHISLAALGNFVAIDGTLELSAGYNVDVSGEDVSYRYQQSGFLDPRGPFSLGRRDYPPNPRKSPLRVTINQELRFVVHGIGQKTTSFDLLSPSGSLVPSEDSAPFAAFTTNTAEQISFSALGQHVTIDGSIELLAGWNESATDVSFEYTLLDVEDAFGPIALQTSDYPGPNLIFVSVDPQFASGMTLSGIGQQILGIDIRSFSGSLIPGPPGDAGPFGVLLENTPNHIAYSSTEGITVSFFVQLPAAWNPAGAPDLAIEFQTLGNRAVAAAISYDFAVPEPSSLALATIAALLALLVRRHRP